MTTSSADGPDDPVDAHLTRLLDDERQRMAANQRRQRAQEIQVARESGSLAGVLVDLGERRESLVLRTSGGRTTRGRVRQVGADFVGVEQLGGVLRLVSLAALTAVHAQPSSTATAGDRSAAVDHVAVTLADVVTTLATERRRALVVTSDHEVVTGRLVSSGQDVVALVSESGHRTYVPLRAVSEVTEVAVR